MLMRYLATSHPSIQGEPTHYLLEIGQLGGTQHRVNHAEEELGGGKLFLHHHQEGRGLYCDLLIC